MLFTTVKKMSALRLARARGEADDHERAAHAEVVDRLRVRLARRSGDDRRVRAEPVRRRDDVLHEVLRLAEVDPLLRAELRHELLLLGARVWVYRDRIDSGQSMDGNDVGGYY